MEFKCSICGAQFYHKRYLTDHNTRVHGIKSRGGQLPCTACSELFSSKIALKKHVLSHKQNGHAQSTVQCREENCENFFRTVCDLRKHLKDFHKIEEIGNSQKLDFENYFAFNQWLSQEEKNTYSKFVISNKKQMKDFHYINFLCSRSGTYKPKSDDPERQLKAQGSKKLGFYCTATIQVKEYNDHVSIIYYDVHYNHDDSFAHIPVPETDKDIIAGKLLQGVAERRIIHDIRNSVGATVERKHLITNKDLQNIKRDYGVTLPSKGAVLSNDEASVHAWVEKMKTAEYNPVLFYKRQDEHHPIINYKDFMLIIMTNFQKNMLSRFGVDRVCVDSTHGISAYGFELITILIVDDYEEGVPVAFCITSTVNTTALKHFFRSVKSALSHNLNPQIFMSDDADMFKNAWMSVFGPCSKYLLCAWHVDRAWQKHILSLKKEKQQDIYNSLKTILYELDIDTFQTMLTNFMEMLQEDPDTHLFYDYFNQYYYPRCEMWAYCFRKGARINTNMHIENFHRCLKHIYLEGKKIKRIDKVIIELINFVNDKNFDAYIKAVKGKITKKTTQNFKRHRNGKNLEGEIKEYMNEDNKWIIISGKNEYIVTKKHNCNNSCRIACRNCTICTTAYECSCPDQQITDYICKHIHFLILSSTNKEQNFIGPLNKSQDNSNTNKNTTEETLLKNSKLNCHESNKLKITSLCSKLSNIENMDNNVSHQIRHHLNAIEHLIQITGENSIISVNKTNSEPSNKKITNQKRFHSVKKPRSNKRIKLSKPSCDKTTAKRAILLKKVPLSSNDSNFDHLYI